jgi:hypothetical protein
MAPAQPKKSLVYQHRVTGDLIRRHSAVRCSPFSFLVVRAPHGPCPQMSVDRIMRTTVIILTLQIYKWYKDDQLSA